VAADVFISYSTKNKDVANAVCAVLEERGIECWIAPRNILPGREWSEEIIQGISDCRVMLVVLSQHSNASQQVRREVERAVHKGAHILPFRIEDIQPTGALEAHLDTRNRMDALTPPMEFHIERLAHATQKLLPTLPVAAPLPQYAAKVPGPRQMLVVPAVAPNSPLALQTAETNSSDFVADLPKRDLDVTARNEDVAGFNWAAFALNWQWLNAHAVHLFLCAGMLAFFGWLGLLSGLIWGFGLWWVWVLLALGIPVWIYAGMRGNALSWQEGEWANREEWKRTQRFWTVRSAVTWMVLVVAATIFVRSGWNLRARLAIDNAIQQNRVTREIGQRVQRVIPVR